jgi:hypothetical protein
MHEYTDKHGTGWRIELHNRSVRQLWDLLRINFHDPGDLGRICNQERYLLLPQILAVLCRQQAERVYPDLADKPDQLLARWEELLASDFEFDDAHEKFLAELSDFCRSRGRAAVAKYLDATPRLLAKEAEANLRRLPDLVQLEADLDRRLLAPVNPETPGDSSTNTPEKSESTATA